jgi:ubiquitin-protein ligase
MYQSPRMRRLRNDLVALERLRSDSSIFRFTTQGDPPQNYRIHFQGRGLWRDHGKVKPLEKHHVEIKLGSSYPRTIPEIRWLTPIYHPNISEIGMVCLGGYGTHWVPSVQLDELCTMLWDMVRYHNYDIRSPYNRDAALWVAQQQLIRFPTDARPLRDLRAALGRVAGAAAESGGAGPSAKAGANGSGRSASEESAKGRLGRVRHFAQRYGRIFGMAEDPVLPTTEPADGPPTVPVNSELHDLVAAQAAAATPDGPAPDREPIFILDPEPEPAADARPAAATEGAAYRPLFARPPQELTTAGRPGEETVDVAGEVRRLLAGREPAASPSEEIVFIE